MISLVMAGGRGSRMKINTEKLLLKYKKPIILHVIDALKNSGCFEKIFALTSPHAPQTRRLLCDLAIPTIQTKGDGYVKDLNITLKELSGAVFVVSGDLPLLDGEIIRKIIDKYDPHYDWQSFVVTRALLDSVGLSGDFLTECKGRECFYTGLSLVNADSIDSLRSLKEQLVIIDDKRIAFNLNTKQEYDLLGTT